MTLHYSYNYSYDYNYATLQCTALDYTTRCYTTVRYCILHYTNYTTLVLTPQQQQQQPQLQLQLQLHYTNYTTLQLQLNYATLQLQPHCNTLHPAVVCEVTTETIASTPKSTTPTTFWSISGFDLPSKHHNNSPLL